MLDALAPRRQDLRPFMPERVLPRIGLKSFQAAALLASWAIAAAAHGQGSADQAVERAQLLRNEPGLREDPYQAVTGSDDSHAESSPNDPDLGEQAILRRQEAYRPFTVSAGLPIFYTSNVALSRSNEQGDAVFSPAVGFTYSPRLTSTLYANISVGQQEFYYSEFDEFDFGSFDARAGLTYVLPKLHDLSLHAEYAYNRLTTSNSFDEFFSSHSFVLNAEIPFRIGRAQQVSVGADASFNIHSTPDQPGRHDFDVYTGYVANVTRSISLNAVARLAVRDYTDDDRTDVSEVLSLGASYRISRWFSLAGSATYAHNDSSRDVFSYDVVNVGGSLTFVYRF